MKGNTHITAQRKAQVRHLEQELQVLRRAWYNLGYVPLDKPIRNGWYKHLVLRQDVARRQDAHVFQEILNACARWVWGQDKPMANRRWQHNAKSNTNWQWAGLAYITKERFQALSPRAQRYFVAYEWKWTPWQGSLRRYYCLVPQYYYVTAYAKAYLTHKRVIDSQLQHQIHQLENQLLGNELYAHTQKPIRFGTSKWSRRRTNRQARQRAKVALKMHQLYPP